MTLDLDKIAQTSRALSNDQRDSFIRAGMAEIEEMEAELRRKKMILAEHEKQHAIAHNMPALRGKRLLEAIERDLALEQRRTQRRARQLALAEAA